ncbi:ABC transporter permease [Clostridium ganghwense]|uniref:FtsX-like permease family protein n=1 Tax=Clostridium ganghwense TaxID=312089 RepID=A0ABT4CK59_9CLOT|nr:ABC transporter permease [Clostridium ganghwense]MCY6369435.1 FtsX-like permease family protein [Clostridium ganghwense]
MLFLKMLRDIKENKASYIACIIVVMTGLLVFTCMSMVSNNLNTAKERFYKNANFAHGFISVKNLPYSQVDDLSKINGIKQIEGRVIKDVRVYTEDSNKNIYLRLISIDLSKDFHLNSPILMEGNNLKNNSNNILVDTNFLKANNLKIGDKINLIIEGKKIEFTISGTEMSPDFVYAMKSGQDLFPNPEAFGIAYIPYDVIQSYLKEKNSVNDISFTLEDDVEYENVEDDIKAQLEKYSLMAMYPRKDQPSNLMLTQELSGLEGMAKSLPIMFLGIAGFILYIMLKRTIEQQRGQIGILKSFGYSSGEVLYHYMSYAVFVGIIGGALGGISGIVLAQPMTEMYKAYFSIPNLTSSFSFYYMLLGIIIALVTSLIAGFQGSKKVLKLHPAEAMRAETPKEANKTIAERIKLFWNSLNGQGKMAVRNIFRNKGRSLFTLVGVMFAFSLMCTYFNAFSLFDVMFNDQYEKVQIYDCKLSFETPISSDSALRDIQHRKEVKLVEPMLKIPSKLTNQWHEKDVPIIGLTKGSQLYNILDKNNNKIKLPDSGVVLSERAAELLDAKVGTVLQFESPLLGDEKKKIYVAKIVPQYLGMSGYMNIDALSELIGNEEMATSMMLKIEDGDIKNFKEHYNKSSVITGIEVKAELVKKINELMQSSKAMIWSFLIFSIIIGFIIIYTSSVISFSERERELASLRVLGFTEKEVLEVLSVEQFFISIFSVLLGIPVTKGMMSALAKSFSNDLYTMPSIIKFEAIAAGIIGTVISLFIAKAALNRKINKLNLVDVLKERE